MCSVDDVASDCDAEKYKTCLGCTVSELNCEWCNGDCQYSGTCNSAQVPCYILANFLPYLPVFF